MPDSFSHRWDYIGGRATLMIDFPDESQTISQPKMEERQQFLRKALLDETKRHYDKFLQ